MESKNQSQLIEQLLEDHPYLDQDCNEEYNSMQICEGTTSSQYLPSQNYKPHEFYFDISNIELTDEQETAFYTMMDNKLVYMV